MSTVRHHRHSPLCGRFQLTAGIIRKRAPLTGLLGTPIGQANALAECRSFQDVLDAFPSDAMID